MTSRRYIPLIARRTAAVNQNGICPACGLCLTGNAELDHAQELADGGTNDIGNLRWLHPWCHLRKSNVRKTGRAKADRIARKRAGTWRKHKYRWPSRALPSRPFPKKQALR